jgi:Disulphide bond corrector protein DsbC
MLMLRKLAHGSVLLVALAAAAQDAPGNLAPDSLGDQSLAGRKTPSVTMSPAAMIKVTRGKSNTVKLRFRVGAGFHVNSSHPKSEFLIPTSLKLNPPTDIMIGGVTFPAGEEMSFAFAPDDKLSVYTGEFPVTLELRPLAEVLPARYMIHGVLRYQACDNSACYPPKKLPVQFEVQIIKAPPPPRKNPAQSPHVHT